MNFRDLRTSDLKSLSNFIGGMNDCADMLQLESFVHSNIRCLADGDVSVWNDCTWDYNIRSGSSWPEFDAKFWDTLVPIVSKYLYQHPTVREVSIRKHETHASRFADYAYHKDFLNTELYNEAYDAWGCRHSCLCAVDTGERSHLIVNVNRENSNFGVRELQIFQALGSYLHAAYHRLKMNDQLNRQLEMMTSQDGRSFRKFWLRLGPWLYIRNASDNAHVLLRRNFNLGGCC